MPASLENVFRALADPIRRELLDRLWDRSGQTTKQLYEHLQVRRSSLSKHLAILERAALVITVGQGRDKRHDLNPTPIYEICHQWIAKYEQHRLRGNSPEDRKTSEADGENP